MYQERPIAALPGARAGRRRSRIACVILASLGCVAPAHARTSSAQPDKPPMDDPAGEIVVTAPSGDALVRPETVLGEDDIAGYGARSIDELLHRIAPLIDGGGDGPVLLVNGKRIDGGSGIAGFPPEALRKLAILPPEAAARYGYPPGRRVVNLVLKPHFSSWSGSAGVAGPTAGDRDSEQMSIGRVVIDGANYWNMQLRLSRDSALLKSSRAIPADGAVDLAGHVAGLDGGEIDPSLSLLANGSVTVAGIPSAALLARPALADFAATANAVHLSDPGAYETLLPSTHAASVTAGLTRPFGGFSGSINLNASRSDSQQRLGFPSASLVLPADNPWSPFGRDVRIVPGFASARPLESEQSATSVGLSALLSGMAGGWRTSLTMGYAHGASANDIDRGVDTAAVQSRIDARDPSLDPYRPWPRSALRTDRTRGTSDSLSAQVNAQRTLATIPAGPVSTNLSANLSDNRSASNRIDGLTGSSSRTGFHATQIGTGLSIAMPLASRGNAVLPLLGELSVDLSGTVTAAAGGGTQSLFTGGWNWSPIEPLQLSGSVSFASLAPTPALRKAPRVETPTRLYDYARQEVADIIYISGGNPALSRGRQRNVSLRAVLRPLGDQRLTVTSAYTRQAAQGGYTSFPTLTPAVAASFPDRIVRDAAGRLLSVDARPINIVRSVAEQLDTAVALMLSGSAERRGGAPPARPMARPVRFVLSIDHDWRLRDRLLVRPGYPAIDQLSGGGGQPRHVMTFQLTASTGGTGASLTGDWRNTVQVRDATIPDGSNDVRYAAMTRFNFGLFAEPLRSRARAAGSSFLANVRLSIDVQNMFDARQRIVLGNGGVPAGQTRDALDPLGRVVQLSIDTRW